ncbi:MAG: carboxypeptidase regulatory-like domain-containing protein [Candidatus Delongbacteria bacterium]|nr:carboxypeptidase regulatory-like domain-containing protein [Candidatus Delongbacteria bacterium]
MKKFFKLFLSLTVIISLVLMISCSDDDGSPDPTILKVITINGADSVTLIEGADVKVYASDGELAKNDLTDEYGQVVFEITSGDYYLNITANGFESVPEYGTQPDTFVVKSERTTTKEIYMRPVTMLKIIVKDILGAPVPNANVVVFHAETNESEIRDFTDENGICNFNIGEGNYYLNVTAQSYFPSPAPTVTPVPFYVVKEDTTVQERILFNNLLTDIGYIQGYVEPPMSNFLILADDAGSSNYFAASSGPDGYFILYNLPYATYDIAAYKQGYVTDSVVTSTISAVAQSDSVTINVLEVTGSNLSGSVTFLATTDTLDVDIVMRDPETMQVIPGMITQEIGGNYSFSGIPEGDFMAWASFGNDGYVMDPDWIFKNPGALNVSFPTDNNTTLNFSVTGSIKMISPTNPADSIYAFVADSIVPTFSWVPYPSTKEYIIEVRDLSGNILWGGFDAAGNVNHGYIDDSVTSIEYDFDGTATQALIPGQIYQWKIWADKGTAIDSGVEQLISASEDLRGIFTVPVGK